MRKILAVIKREYIQIVRTKGFIIGTILGPVLMAGMLVVPMLVASMSVEKQETIGVADLSRDIFLDLDKKLGEEEYRLKDGFRRYVLKKFERFAGSSVNELKKDLNAKVLNKELSAYILIPEHVLGDEAAVSAVQEAGSGDNDIEYVSQHTTDYEKLGSLNSALNSVIIEKRLKREGLDPEKISQFIQRVRLKPIKVTKKGEEEDTMGTFWVSYFLALIIYMAIFIYGSVIMRGVIEEKSSRVIEIILSSMRPFQLMLGKILGIGAVGLTQFSIWAIFGLAVTSFSKSFIPAGVEISLVSIPPMFSSILWFSLSWVIFCMPPSTPLSAPWSIQRRKPSSW